METPEMAELWERIIDYMKYDEEEGGIKGVKEESPEEVREAWQKLKAIYDKAEAEGEKI